MIDTFFKGARRASKNGPGGAPGQKHAESNRRGRIKKYFFQAVARKNCPVSKARIYSLLFLCLVAGPVLFPACDEDEEKTRQVLEEELQTDQADAALLKIRTLLVDSNLEHSTVLSDRRHKNRELAVSPDGETLFFREGGILYYRPAGTADVRSVELPAVPTALRFSFGGRFALAVYRAEDGKAPEPVCRLLPIALETGRVMEESLIVAGCESDPTVTDRGLVYFAREGALFNQQITPEKAGQSVLHSISQDSIPATAFPPKFKKIKMRFSIFDISAGDLLIFHGAAGYYRLYHYVGKDRKVTLLGENFAQPRLYPVYHKLSLRPAPEPKPGTPGKVEKPAPKPGADGLRLKEPTVPGFFVYAGSTGNFTLRRIDLGQRLQLRGGIKLRPLDEPSYLEKENAFLLLRNKTLCLWPPGKRFEFLPLETENFAPFNGGLMYEDAEGRLRLRESAFTRHEAELLDLKFQAEKSDGPG